MKKLFYIFIIISIVTLSSGIVIAQTNQVQLIEKLIEIRSIDNDIERLQEYDKLVDSLNIVDDMKTDETKSTNKMIVKHSGSGMKTTRPFKTEGPWEIQWNAQGDIFQIYLYNESGNLVDVAANQMGAGEGSFYSPKKGSFYIEVNAMGKWELKIIDLNN